MRVGRSVDSRLRRSTREQDRTFAQTKLVLVSAHSPGGIAREGVAAMAGFRDRPLIRDALLAGGVIAASAVAALIALDRGPVSRHHFRAAGQQARRRRRI